MGSEVLQNNPFLSALFDHIPGLEQNCVSNHWVLCIPQIVALPSPHKLSLRLLKSHVLVPLSSAAEFETLSGLSVARLNEKELLIRDGSEKRTVTILFKEIVYSGLHGDEAYTLLCLSRPLLGSGSQPVFDDGVTEVFDEDRGAEEWMQVLFSTPRKQAELAALESKVYDLKDPLACPPGSIELQSYCIIRNAARHWAQREVKENEAFQAARLNARFQLLLITAFESCATLMCHSVLFASLADRYEEAENDIQFRLHDLRRIVLEEMGFDEKSGLTSSVLSRFEVEGDAAFQVAVAHLQNLVQMKSPLGKLMSLKRASHSLKEMKTNVNMDDTLPLFLLALLHAAPGLLLANLAYLVDFQPRAWLKANGELAFHATVFQGAVSLIQNHVPLEVDEPSLLRNLIISGGSGIGVGGSAGKKSTTAKNRQAAPSQSPSTVFDWLHSCAPSFRS